MKNDSFITANPYLDPANSSPGNMPPAWTVPFIPSDPPAGARVIPTSILGDLSVFDATKIAIIGISIAIIGGIVFIAFGRR